MKIHPVRAELFYADRRADGQDESNSHFLQFCESAKNAVCLKTENESSRRNKIMTTWEMPEI